MTMQDKINRIQADGTTLNIREQATLIARDAYEQMYRNKLTPEEQLTLLSSTADDLMSKMLDVEGKMEEMSNITYSVNDAKAKHAWQALEIKRQSLLDRYRRVTLHLQMRSQC